MSIWNFIKKAVGYVFNPGNAISDVIFDVAGKAVGLDPEQRATMRNQRFEAAQQAEANKAALAKARIDYKIKKLDYQAERFRQTDRADLDYDQMIIRANQNSFFDEVVASIFLLLILFTIFTPVYYQIQAGEVVDLGASWQALAEAPWWFGFSIVGIIVSRLGLMRFFRLWIDRFNIRRKNQKNSPVEGREQA